MANDENKIILEFPATNVEIEFGETITFDNISGFLNSDRVTYNGESLTEEIAHLEDDKADTTYVDEQLELKADKATTYTKTQSDNRYLGKTNPSGTGYFSLNRRGSTGAYSVSVGWHNEASAQSSFAEGENNASSGYASHSEGYGNAASGLMAHAEGVTTESSGYGSHSEGVGTIANHIGQHVFGAYNVADPSTAQPTAKGNYIEIVGNGTDDDRRRNARTLDWQGNEMLMGDLTFNGDKSLTSEISRLDGKIDNLPAPMIFKGTLGVGGTIQTLPTASASNEGYTYKVITDGTYAGQTAKVGDVFTSNGSAWVLIPSGDEDNDTWRAIKVEGVEVLGNGISSGAVDFVGSENIEVDFDGNGNKVGVKTKNIYTKEEVDDIVYNILPDDTASGSVANFETDLALPLKSLEIDVNAKQDLHGYSYPWIAGGGKNLCSVRDVSVPLTYTPITLDKPIPAGTYTLSANLSASYGSCDARFRDADGNNIISVYINASSPVRTSVTFTLTQDAYRIYFYSSRGTAGYTAEWKDIQVEVGSTATSWTPYENICPISGRSYVSVVHCGKNLYQYDESKVSTGTTTTSTTRAYYPLGFKGVTSLTFSANLKSGSSTTASDYLNIGKLRKSDGLIEILSQLITPDGITTRTLSISSDDDVVLVSLENPTVIKSILNRYDIQIEVGSSASSFEPYAEREITVQFGQTIYKGTLDVKNSKVIATYTQLVLTADNTNIIGRVNANKYRVLNSNCGAKIIGSDYADILCDILKSQTGTTNDGRCYINASGDIRMNFAKEYNSIADMIADVGSITLVYPLAEPIEIPLPAISQFTTLIGTNNIFADTGDTSVVFKDSVNGYVEKKIANVQALTLNT